MWLVIAACGQPMAKPVVAPPVIPGDPPAPRPVPVIDAAQVSDDEKLAAIQKAMNDLSPASQQCWAAVAAVRFDVEGELAAQIDIGPPNHVTYVHDTTKSPKLAACLAQLLEAYPWAPPLRGQAIQLPFKFSAPDGQSVIDRRLVPFAGQGNVSVAVALDENNSGNPAASIFEVAIAAGGTTGMRTATRAEVWMALDGDVEISAPGLKATKLSLAYVPAGGARELRALGKDAHLVVVVTPGGPEGAARAGALPTPELTAIRSAPAKPRILDTPIHPKGHAEGHAEGHEIYLETGPMSVSLATIPKGTIIPVHVHANETELLVFLAGSGMLLVNGVTLPITETSVVQIPPNTKHAFTASSDVRALQIYTPPGPEQRWK
ncbi:MAG: cupin domain-containing protein [Kofleriaceae bacterium]